MKKTLKLRKLLEARSILIAPGAFDALSAHLIEKAGFSLIYATVGGIVRSMGYPDKSLVTMSEVVAHVKNMVDATTIPVFANADTGFGNALNVIRTIKEFEVIGVAGIHIEDKLIPKKYGQHEDKSPISEGEMIKKIEAAREARTDTDFLIVACTDAHAVGGLQNAIQRGKRYAEAGADMIFIEALRSAKEIKEVARSISTPLVINIFRDGKTLSVSMNQLEVWGYRIAIIPSALQLAAIHAMRQLLKILQKEGTLEPFLKGMVSFQERDDIAGYRKFQELERRFLSLRAPGYQNN